MLRGLDGHRGEGAALHLGGGDSFRGVVLGLSIRSVTQPQLCEPARLYGLARRQAQVAEGVGSTGFGAMPRERCE